jgi:hypothetical protein
LAARENGPTHKALALSLSHANACSPLLQAHPTWAQGNTKAAGFPFCLLLPPFVLCLAPTHLGWDTCRQFTRWSRDPSGSKRRQLARQVGASYVLTNSFPSSSKWVVFSNLSEPAIVRLVLLENVLWAPYMHGNAPRPICMQHKNGAACACMRLGKEGNCSCLVMGVVRLNKRKLHAGNVLRYQTKSHSFDFLWHLLMWPFVWLHFRPINLHHVT